MNFTVIDDDGPPFYVFDWGDGVDLYFSQVQIDRRRLLAQVHVSNEYGPLLAPSSIDVLDARSRRSIANAVIDSREFVDPSWPARIEDAAEQLHTHLDIQQAKDRGIKLVSVEDVDTFADLECLIEDFIQQSGIGLIIGDPGSLKTVTGLDMAACVGTGRPWHDHQVKQGSVVYIYAEGIAGLKRRKAAWERLNGVTMRNIRFVPHPVPLLDDAAVDDLLAAIADDPPALVVIDTVARAMAGGDENSTMDMGRLIDAADRIKRETGGAVLLIHHLNKLGEFRGNTALMAGIDNAIKVVKENDTITLTCEKAKDLEPFLPLDLLIVPIEGSVALIRENDESRAERMQNNLTPAAHDLLECLEQSAEGYRYNEWVDASGMSKGRAFSSAHNELKAAKLVDQLFGRWVSKRPNKPTVPTVPNSSGTAGTGEFREFHTPVWGGTRNPEPKGNGSEGINGSTFDAYCIDCSAGLPDPFLAIDGRCWACDRAAKAVAR